MEKRKFLTEDLLPFCKGCGHTTIGENLDRALQKLGFDILDVVVVTDIGCHGILDKNLRTHTVHGLHGRSAAVGAGISAALEGSKKVIVMLGDGGATIGLQHLIDAAHRNFDMTVIVHNNFLYGMTGGQPSEFTPAGFKTSTYPEGSNKPYYDLSTLMVQAGASFVSRINGIGDFSEHLAHAVSKKGFSLVEVMEICPSYGLKHNPGMKLASVVKDAGLDIKVLVDRELSPYSLKVNEDRPSLIQKNQMEEVLYQHQLNGPQRILLFGSAGGGVQTAAELLARAAVRSGLQVSKKGSYPVTVGIGFSAAEVILSPDEIHFTGSPEPDHVVILTQDGLDYARDLLQTMTHGVLWKSMDLETLNYPIEIQERDFQGLGSKNAAIKAIFQLVSETSPFPLKALEDAFREKNISSKLDVSKLVSV